MSSNSDPFHIGMVGMHVPMRTFSYTCGTSSLPVGSCDVARNVRLTELLFHIVGHKPDISNTSV